MNEFETWVNEADNYLTECGVPEHGAGGELFSLRHRILLYGQAKTEAERERCAQVAGDWARDIFPKGEPVDHATAEAILRDVQVEIAKEIREGGK